MKKHLTIALLLKTEVGDLNESNIAGTERIFLQDIEQFTRAGYSTIAFSRFAYFPFVKKLWYPRALLQLVYQLEKVKHGYRLSRLIFFILELSYFIQFLLRTLKADIVIGYSVPVLALFRPKKTIIIMENYHDIVGAKYWKNRYQQALFLFCSSSLFDSHLKKYARVLKKNGQVLYNAVDISNFRPLPKLNRNTSSFKKTKTELALLFCGAWHPQKGLDILLQALNLLPKTIREKVSLTISSNRSLWYSDKPYSNQRYVKKLHRLMKNTIPITHLGGVPYEKMPAVYQSHDILVFPSVWKEPFGLTVLEATACGLPVLGFNVGALPEILSSSNSYLLEERSPVSLAKAIKNIAQGKVKLEKKYQSLLEIPGKNESMIKGNRFKRLLEYVQNRLLTTL